MPVLNWIGKEAVVNHDKEVPFRLLKKIKAHSIGETSQNLIIHGDNLEALKALMPYYQGKIKCIYIDPPYNTGNEGWVYNDKVNSPKIKKWLGKVVGGEAEDLCRHDKWLCMMYPRLKLLRDLLSEDGVIFVSIDDNENYNLRQLMNDIFGEDNYIQELIWHSKYTVSNDAKFFSRQHEYILCYSKNISFVKVECAVPRTEEANDRYANSDNDSRGPWKATPLHAKSGKEENNFEYTFKNGIKWKPPKGRFHRFSFETLQKLDVDDRIWFGKDLKSTPSVKTFLSELSLKMKSGSIIPFSIGGHTHKANEQLADLMDKGVFQNPKSVDLIKLLTSMSTDSDDIILDSFAGSGTTGQAVTELNNDQNSNRKFILIEIEDDVAKDITAERVKRVIQKYNYKDGFEYCELDKSLFNEDGQIEEECSFEQLATYIYFTETNTNLDKKAIDKNLIGDYNETEFYLLFKDKGRNILNKDFLKKISKNSKKKVIYADKCIIDDKTLNKHKIQFKQIPYEVKVY
ncbi:TPA: site-specific DNA-methyltransferase [Candidatus Woesearchaeota archaeon]|nr:site-specific DNA-methyltransferase [Candidatus Woesearchaeota archaeon]HIH31199.1 site-specific DNA-methyltransferase [Candidatus Woesearchaeota archaeon]HIH55534.1 site-specific DNA-methyltransferase [Candidatus Woesearchaeota archaeon]HIJ01845.1 site-specific DNA-methyltransferase [Candidatus Woesearchaeota archaeon]HIJ13138.1 site-specific DNA-methyltransferase [Candidatus Woesearchaeota archaeon]